VRLDLDKMLYETALKEDDQNQAMRLYFGDNYSFVADEELLMQAEK
jgi:hypothetical protein